MSNIKHYIDGIRNGGAYFTIDKKMLVESIAFAVINAVYTILFYLVSNWLMMIYSAVSVGIFAGFTTALIKKKKYSATAYVTAIVVTIETILATITSGFSTGFAFYSFVLITSSFYFTYVLKKDKRNDFVPLFLSLLFILIFFANYIIDKVMTAPIYAIENKGFSITFFALNLVICFGATIVFNFLFLWEISLKETTLESQNETLTDMAHKDPLTKLLNRRNMNDFLDKSAEDMKLTGKRFSLILGDIDDFKHVNDTYGHDAGDAVLVNIAEIIRSSVRANDAVCRWGGEEFLILINASGETASNTAERIRKSIENTTIAYKDQEIKVTMTFGLAEAIPGYKVDALIHQADDKLYIGKNSGKNTVII
ncbi:MAG: GGDEF domain-containing protein [Lachnospiraceae bacterium]|nr:GGDEF domain-containing protein [Lachnospiraceae bacterium]